MDTFKLRLKVGVHEFEAEGSRDDVQTQLDIWKKLIEGSPATLTSPVKSPLEDFKPVFESLRAGQSAPLPMSETGRRIDELRHLDLFEQVGNVIRLRAYPSGERAEDAVLLAAYGYRVVMNLDVIGSVMLGRSLRESGGTVDRVDRAVGGHINRGYMMRAGGSGRGMRYRLTNTGLARAEALAKELFETLA